MTDRTHTERIRCPRCGLVQTATVRELWPWDDLTHQCEGCGYWITESDWQREGEDG